MVMRFYESVIDGRRIIVPETTDECIYLIGSIEVEKLEDGHLESIMDESPVSEYMDILIDIKKSEEELEKLKEKAKDIKSMYDRAKLYSVDAKLYRNKSGEIGIIIPDFKGNDPDNIFKDEADFKNITNISSTGGTNIYRDLLSHIGDNK